MKRIESGVGGFCWRPEKAVKPERTVNNDYILVFYLSPSGKHILLVAVIVAQD